MCLVQSKFYINNIINVSSVNKSTDLHNFISMYKFYLLLFEV